MWCGGEYILFREEVVYGGVWDRGGDRGGDRRSNGQENKDFRRNQMSYEGNKKLRVIALGGCKEIGKNCTVFEYGNEIVVIDCGVMFPESGMPGIDLVIPDLSYLMKNITKLKGVILTHGHEDHIGAIVYLIKMVKVPIYGSKFTLGLVKNKLGEHHLLGKVELNCVNYREEFGIGKNFKVELLKVTHSIADSSSVLLKIPSGLILHTGDFKIDHTPIDGERFDFYRFAKLGESGLLLLLSDSTNIMREGSTLSEKRVYNSLLETFKKAKGRIFVAMFASNIHRIQIIMDLAKEFNKKVAIVGKSMEGNIQIAKELGYLKFSKDQILRLEELKDFPKSKTILITTGTQGEPMSALWLLAYEKHKWLVIEDGDNIIISASVIPGNEKEISKIINNLLRMGTEVTYEDVHVSGHGYREELKLMLSLTKPKFFIPIHGEYRNLKKHIKLANEMGIPESNCKIMENGDIIEVEQDSINKKGQIDIHQIFVDGKGVGDVGNRVIQDRKILSRDGIVVVIIKLSKKEEKMQFKTEIISRGFVYMKESSGFFEMVNNLVMNIVKNQAHKITSDDYNSFKNKIKKGVGNFFYNQKKRNPMVVVRIIEF